MFVLELMYNEKYKLQGLTVDLSDGFCKLSVVDHFLHDIQPTDKFSIDNQLGERRPIVQLF